MRRVAAAIICTFSATFALADCAKSIPVQTEYKQAQSVVIGTVESSQRVPQTWDSFDGTNYVVNVDQKVKGKESGKIVVFSEHSQDGYPLKVGQQYLLFLNYTSQHWMVNHCGNSGELDESGQTIKMLAHMFGND